MTVPADLVRWFDGKQILAERHNLPRIEVRWRVVEVLAFLGQTDDPWVAKGEWREFKTAKAAERYRDKLAASGATALIQPGFTFWPDPEEWPHA
jgi:glutaredoxin 2